MEDSFDDSSNCIDESETDEYLDNEDDSDNFKNNQPKSISDQCIINACIEGDLDLIEEYINSGHDVNEFLITGWTLLLYAASYVQPNVVQYLLNCGANPNIHQEGYTPLMALCASNGETHEKRMKCLKLLIDGQADVNAINKLKETALMYACKTQEISFVQELLKYVVHINFANTDQRTALFFAVISNRKDIVELLIEKGADITWMNYSGLSPYDVALTKGFHELLPLLTVNQNKDQENDIKIIDANSWLDMFPKISKMNIEQIDGDVLNLLNGMGLECYKSRFCGIDLKTFLRLREEDLERLGIDISIHRKKFVDELLRFHKYEWKNNLMTIHNSKDFSPFEAVKVLGNINKQLSIMSSSIYFSKNCLDSIEEDEELNLSNEEKEELQNEIRNIQLIALRIKNATSRIKTLAEVLKEENDDLTLPIHIKKKNKKNNLKWIIITVLTLTGICLFRLKRNKKIWNNEKSFFQNCKNMLSFSLTDIIYNNIYRVCLFFQNNSRSVGELC